MIQPEAILPSTPLKEEVETSGGRARDVFLIRGLPLSWSETDVRNALGAVGVTGIGLIQTLTEVVRVHGGHGIVVRNGDAIVEFRSSFGSLFLEKLGWTRSVLTNKDQLQIHVLKFDLTDTLDTPEMAILQNKVQGDGFTAYVQEELSNEWHRRFMESREETLQCNYRLFLSAPKDSNAAKKITFSMDSEIPATNNNVQPLQLTLPLRESDQHSKIRIGKKRSSTYGLRLVRFDGPYPVFTFVKEVVVLEAEVPVAAVDSSSGVGLVKVKPPTPPKATTTSGCEEVALDTRVERPAESHGSPGIETQINATGMDPNSNAFQHQPSIFYIDGLSVYMDAVDVARLLHWEVGGTLAFSARYYGKAVAEMNGAQRRVFRVPQRDGAVIFNDVHAENCCLRRGTFKWAFPPPPAKAPSRRITVTKMTSQATIAQVLCAFNTQKSITGHMHPGDIRIFDIHHRRAITSKHEAALKQKRTLDSLKRDGYSVKMVEKDMLVVETDWMKSWKPSFNPVSIEPATVATPTPSPDDPVTLLADESLQNVTLGQDDQVPVSTKIKTYDQAPGSSRNGASSNEAHDSSKTETYDKAPALSINETSNQVPESSGSGTSDQFLESSGSGTSNQVPESSGSGTSNQVPESSGSGTSDQVPGFSGSGTSNQVLESSGSGTSNQVPESSGSGTSSQAPVSSGSGTSNQVPGFSGNDTYYQTPGSHRNDTYEQAPGSNRNVASSTGTTSPLVREAVAEVPAPIFVSGVYYDWDAGMVADYFAEEMGCRVDFCTLYAKVVVGTKSDGTSVRLRIPQGSGVFVLQNVAAQRECLARKVFYPDGLRPLPNGGRRHMKVRLVDGERFLRFLTPVMALRKRVTNGMTEVEYDTFYGQFQNMVKNRHITLLDNQWKFNQLHEDDGVAFIAEQMYILDHNNDWWAQKRQEREDEQQAQSN